MSSEDFGKYYDLEKYLFGEVSPTFKLSGNLSTFDFFCIVVWKANRAKSKIARRMLSHGFTNLEDAVATLMGQVHQAVDEKERLRLLIQKWGFRLPMASAILTVLYPHNFTVYDVRVCEMLDDFHHLQYKVDFEALWSGYSQYVQRVRKCGPENISLREKDRWFWGKSFANNLLRDIENKFMHNSVKNGDDA